jgi:hypothetical protein
MKKYKFKAKIQAGDGGGAYVLFPYDTGKEFGTKGKVTDAKKEETRLRRLTKAVEMLKNGVPTPG